MINLSKNYLYISILDHAFIIYISSIAYNIRFFHKQNNIELLNFELSQGTIFIIRNRNYAFKRNIKFAHEETINTFQFKTFKKFYFAMKIEIFYTILKLKLVV